MTFREVNDAKNWRDRAGKMRALPDTMNDPEVVAVMLTLVGHYAKFAAWPMQRCRPQSFEPARVPSVGLLKGRVCDLCE